MARTRLRVFRLLLAAAALAAPARAAGPWVTFADCEFRPDEYFDGDSFHIRTTKGGGARGYTYIFRLYGVDCPETDGAQEPARVAEQARWFNTSEAEVLRWGRRAAEFTARMLRGGPVVHTRKEEARGQSRKNRYFAVVEVGGRDLGLLLVENGLARAYGHTAARGRDSAGEMARLYARAERTARIQRIGIWAAAARGGGPTPSGQGAAGAPR